MADEKGKGILSKIFGAKKSCCCNMRIEEIPDEEKKVTPDANQTQQESCCGTPPTKK